MRSAGLWVAAAAAIWLAALVVVPFLGAEAIRPAELLAGDPAASAVFWQLRLPRVLLGLLAGGSLAVAGASLQTLFRNPLAEPYTLGVASGAALGAVAAQQLAPPSAELSIPVVFLAAFAGAAAVTALLLGLARSRFGFETATLLLAGIAITLSCSAVILLLQYLADFTRTFRMVRWMMGGLAVVGYREVLWLAPWAVAGSAVLFGMRWSLNQLLAGEELALSRGVDLKRLRFWVLGITSVMVGSLVAVTGPIGFVGLIVPHILRRVLGYDHSYLIPASLLAGGAFLAFSDLAARVVIAPAELPVGILTALVGGPFFLWLLIAGKGE
jgi:iron complex transport system permease protein